MNPYNDNGRRKMAAQTIKKRNCKGTVLFLILMFIMTTSIGVASLLYLIDQQCRQARGEVESIKAFYLAESGIQRGLYWIKEKGHETPPGDEYMQFLISMDGVSQMIYFKVEEDPQSVELYRVTAKNTYANKERIIKSRVRINPPWEGFNYANFHANNLFNYAPLEFHGDIRTNGACIFAESTTEVDGDIYASQYILGDCEGEGGLEAHRFEGIYPMPVVPIDINYYQSIVTEGNGTVSKGSSTLINRAVTGNVYLGGTVAEPLIIDGPVLVSGDVIIHGRIQGQGTIYAGRNIYIPNDLIYNNSPGFPAPDIDDTGSCDVWVRSNRNRTMVVLAAKEFIVFGDYTSTDWQNWMDGVSGMSYTNLYAKGEEDRGENFILDTEIGQAADTGEGDDLWGQPDGVTWAWNYEDLDRDGNVDGFIRYNQEITTQVDFNAFSFSPGGTFSSIASNTATSCDAVLYSPHVICGLSGNMEHNGGITSDEHLHWYTDGASFYKAEIRYDPRVHCRYRWDPTNDDYYIDKISLPVDEKYAIFQWWEEAEEEES